MDEQDLRRTEAFSDGVFAIAITLLALDLASADLDEPTQARLANSLAGLAIPFLAFALSFGSIFIMWANHHRLFRMAHDLGGQLLFSNGLLLMLVALCPVPTALLAKHMGTDAGELAAAVYAGYFVLVNVAYNLLVEAIGRGSHRAQHGPDDATLRLARWQMRFGFVAYALAVGVAWIEPWLTFAICALMWGFWARAPFQRAKRSRRERAS